MRRGVIGVLVLVVPLLTCLACAPSTLPATPQPTNTPPREPSAAAPSPDPTAPKPTERPEDTPTSTPEPPVAARVNDRPIYLADYDQALIQYEVDLRAQGVDPESDEGKEDLAYARTWILYVMIEQALTEQAAEKEGIVVTDEDVDAYIADLVTESGGQDAFEEKLAKVGDTPESAWQKTRSGLIGMAMIEQVTEGVPTVTEHVRARHILVDTEQEAQSLLDQLQGGADFVALAQAYSHDLSTRDNGGDLGFFPRGLLVAPEVEDVAFFLQPEEISDVVASALGYHIVQVIEIDPAREVAPENLRLLQDQAVQKWIEGLWAEAEIEYLVETAP